MDQIGLYFKCQSCLDYVLSNNIQCPNGHQVCQGCFENLSYCPTCHQRVAPSTRIPFLLTSANVDPILNVGDSFDLLLPSLLRLAPAIHPCSADEMIFTENPSSLTMLNSLSSSSTSSTAPSVIDNNRINDNTNSANDDKNNSLADQLLIASSFEVEETLSRLMMLASMSPGPGSAATTQQQSIAEQTNLPINHAVQQPPPGLMNSSKPTPLPTSLSASSLLDTTNSQFHHQPQQQQHQHQQQKQQLDGFPDFSV